MFSPTSNPTRPFWIRCRPSECVGENIQGRDRNQPKFEEKHKPTIIATIIQ
jgi:hypothetical protein